VAGALGRRDMAIDFGTANTVVYVRGDGIVLSEPSVVAIHERAGQGYAVGTEAERMIAAPLPRARPPGRCATA
jgi:rod shape-determining protein MreB and related proteins